MKDQKYVIIGMLVLSTVLGGIGQFLFKYAFQDSSLLLTLAAGLLMYAMSTAMYFYVLSRMNLSWAYGFNGITYIVAVALASSVLMEHVSLLRWVGVIVIAIGVVLVGVS